LADVSPPLRQIENRIGRAVNPTTYTAAEFAQKWKAGSRFLQNATAGKKLFVFGGDDDLAELIGERTAEAPHD
jgi:hypothetical protein